MYGGIPTMPWYWNVQYLVRYLQPLAQYGCGEAEVTGCSHAMLEVALIAYLMGMGYDQRTARRIVESWEQNEKFPGEV